MQAIMTSLLNRIMQMGQGDKPRDDSSSTRLPARPPRPNFEDLTPEEVEKMNEVIRKIEVMDRQESDKIRIMRESIQRFEEHQKRQLSERNRFLASTNYLCRLCFKTKFVEKTARVCSSCGFKICSRCGLYTHDLVGGKQEMVRWRCRLCQLKREYACRTGQWYHGDAAQPVLEKHDLWLAVQKTRHGGDSSYDGRRASDPSLLSSISMSRGRPVSDISINHGHRNSRDLTYFTRARGTMVPPRHPPNMKRPPNQGPPPPTGLPPGPYRPRAGTVGKCQRSAMQQMKPRFQSLPNKFDTHLPRSPSRDGPRTPTPAGSRESFRSDDSVFLVGSLNASKPLAQSSPNISELDFDPRGSRDPLHRGSKESVNSRRGRAPCEMRVRGSKVRSHSLSREQALSNAENAGLSSSLSVSELIALSAHSDWRTVHESRPSERNVDSEKSFETDSSFSDLAQTSDPPRLVEGETAERLPARPPRRPSSLSGSPVPRRRLETSEEISLLQQKCEDLALNVDDTDARFLDRKDSIKSRRKMSTQITESFDSDDFEYDIPYSSTSVQPVIQGWKRYPSSDDKIVFGSGKSKRDKKQHLFIKKRNDSYDRSPVLARMEWTPSRRRSCEVGASPLLRHMRMRNETTCERVSTSSVDESESSVNQDTADSMEPITAHQPTFNIILEAEDDESCISNFHRFGLRVAGGTINEDDELLAVVSQVSPNHPGKIQGHLDKGDEILTWNGQDLTMKTFEEVLLVVDAPVSAVTLNVRRKATTASLDLGDESSLGNDSLDKTQDSELSGLIEKNHSDPEDIQHLMSLDESEDLSGSLKNAAVQEIRNLSREGSVRKKWKSLTTKSGRSKNSSDKSEIRRMSQLSVVTLISGKVEAMVKRQPETKSIEVSLLGVQGLAHRSKDSHQAPNVVVLLRLLPRTEFQKARQIWPKLLSTVYVSTDRIQFDDATDWQLRKGTVELTVWDAQDDNHFEFLGEVLIDFVDLADREGKPAWFPLYDHDENSTLLETPAQVELVLDDLASNTSATSKGSGSSPSLPHVHRLSLSRGDGNGDSSFRSKMKKKMTTAIGKLSVGGDAKREQLPSDGNLKKSLTPTEMEPVKKSPLLARLRKNNTSPSIFVTSEESPTEEKKEYQFGHGSVNNSVEDLDDLDDTDSEAGDKNISFVSEQCNGNEDGERPTPEGDDITNLGPGQVCPRQGIDSPSNGDLKLGVIMTKGQLEVHIMSARGLPIGANGQPPDTYVKTYLTESSKKRTQKKKTNIVKASCEPMYRQKTKYSACNVYRRQIVASVWERSAVFDKNQSLGEVIIDLDDMDLSAMNTSWYRLYKRHTSGADSDSDTMNTY